MYHEIGSIYRAITNTPYKTNTLTVGYRWKYRTAKERADHPTSCPKADNWGVAKTSFPRLP